MSNLVETAKKVGLFKIAMNALGVAGLERTLENTGPFTFLAPTDTAFHKLAPGLMDDLMKNPERLRRILTLHIIPEAATSEHMEDRRRIMTASGEELPVRLEYDGIRIGDARVIEADLIADNGVIHGIDKVLLPRVV